MYVPSDPHMLASARPKDAACGTSDAQQQTGAVIRENYLLRVVQLVVLMSQGKELCFAEA